MFESEGAIGESSLASSSGLVTTSATVGIASEGEMFRVEGPVSTIDLAAPERL